MIRFSKNHSKGFLQPSRKHYLGTALDVTSLEKPRWPLIRSFNHWDSLPIFKSAFPEVSRWAVASYKRGSSSYPGLALPQAPYSASDRPSCFVQHMFTESLPCNRQDVLALVGTGVSKAEAVPTCLETPQGGQCKQQLQERGVSLLFGLHHHRLPFISA